MPEYDEMPGTPESPDPGAAAANREAAAAWTEVMRALDELGSSVAMWVKAVKDDPDTRRRAKEMQDRLEGYGRQIGDTFDAAARSDFARQVGSAAVAAGDVAVDTARKLGDEAAGAVSGALRSVSESIRRAAESTQQRTAGSAETTVEIHVTEGSGTPENPDPATAEEGTAPDDYVP